MAQVQEGSRQERVSTGESSSLLEKARLPEPSQSARRAASLASSALEFKNLLDRLSRVSPEIIGERVDAMRQDSPFRARLRMGEFGHFLRKQLPHFCQSQALLLDGYCAERLYTGALHALDQLTTTGTVSNESRILAMQLQKVCTISPRMTEPALRIIESFLQSPTGVSSEHSRAAINLAFANFRVFANSVDAIA